MNTTTVIIKRNADRNYDRLFRAIEAGAMFGRSASLAEKATPKGYEVTFAYLSPEAMDFLAANPRDFDLA